MSKQINLFNPALKPKRSWLTAGSMAALMGLSVLALTAYGYFLHGEAAAAEKRATAASAEQKSLSAQLVSEAIKVKREPSRMLADEVARLSAIAAERQQMVARLQGTGLGSTDGYSRYLASLARQHAAGVWLTGISVGGAADNIFVRGRALSADLLPGYIQMLNRETSLQGKTISEMQLAEKNTEKAAPRTTGVSKAADKAPKEPSRYIEFSLGSRAATNTDG